jgi:hypothetical protein
MQQQEEYILEKPQLKRSTNMEPTHYGIPILERTDHYSGNNGLALEQPLRMEDLMADQPLRMEDLMTDQPPKLDRQELNHLFNIPNNLPREHGMFPDHFEKDMYTWFNTCNNKKKAEYIKYLTDRIVSDDPRNSLDNELYRSWNDSIHEPRPTTHIPRPVHLPTPVRLGAQDPSDELLSKMINDDMMHANMEYDTTPLRSPVMSPPRMMRSLSQYHSAILGDNLSLDLEEEYVDDFDISNEMDVVGSDNDD